MSFRFLHPGMLLLLLLIPILLYAYFWLEKRGRPRIVFSDLSPFRNIPTTSRVKLRHSLIALRALALSALVIALARPQAGSQTRELLSPGIDIMIALDISTSMMEKDMAPDRLTAAKEVARSFVRGREQALQNDRIGLIVFARAAFTKCPLTVDYALLDKILEGITFTRREFDGTAIGNALAAAVNRLQDSPGESKVVILLTDGLNNAGIDPMLAASAAQAMQVKVYTIGVAPAGMMRRVHDPIFGYRHQFVGLEIDETQMREIARVTGGKYFRAEDKKSLAEIFREIDELEKTEVKVKEFYRYAERFAPWTLMALLALAVELALGRTALRRMP